MALELCVKVLTLFLDRECLMGCLRNYMTINITLIVMVLCGLRRCDRKFERWYEY